MSAGTLALRCTDAGLWAAWHAAAAAERQTPACALAYALAAHYERADGRHYPTPRAYVAEMSEAPPAAGVTRAYHVGPVLLDRVRVDARGQDRSMAYVVTQILRAALAAGREEAAV